MDVVKEIFTADEICFYRYGNIRSLYRAICKAHEEKNIRAPKINKRYSIYYTDIVMSQKYSSIYKGLGEN
jgi:hypothetical protein